MEPSCKKTVDGSPLASNPLASNPDENHLSDENHHLSSLQVFSREKTFYIMVERRHSKQPPSIDGLIPQQGEKFP